MADVDAVLAKLRRTAEALQPQSTVPAAPPIAVEVISLPAPRRWLFIVRRDDQGRLESVLAEPA